MLDIFNITLPIFALIALGYGTVRFGLFAQAEMQVLGKFVLNIALPALLFEAVAARHFTEVVMPGYMLVYLLGGLATLAVMGAVLTIQGTGPARRAIAMMGAANPNSAYVGYPIMLLTFPERAGVILALNMVVEMMVIVPLSFVLLEMSRPRPDGPQRSVAQRFGDMLLPVLRRPMVLALIAGMAVSLLGFDIPTALREPLHVLAGSTSAIALFVIGGALVGIPIRGNRALASEIVIGKLLLHPALTALALLALPLFGFGPLSPVMQSAVILSAAMPMFGIYTILAQDYGHEDIASLALMGATLGSFVTLSALLIWL